MSQVASEVGAKDPPTEASDADSLEAASLTVAQLQEELTKRGLDTKWNPLKGKKELVDRLQARLRAHLFGQTLWHSVTWAMPGSSQGMSTCPGCVRDWCGSCRSG